MGDVKIRYYVTRRWRELGKRGYWQPCLARPNKNTGVFEPTLMAKLGFAHVDCGADGPQAWAIAESWNVKWDAARKAHLAGEMPPGEVERIYPPNSLGEGFAKFRATGEYKTKKPRTREGWMRGWKYIEPKFGDVDPRSTAMEHIDLWYHGDPADGIKGILERHGVGEAYIAMKYWRAIWKQLQSINRPDGQRYCISEDPSLGIRRKTPPKRDAIWFYDEAQLLIDGAGTLELKGMQALLAVAWDTMMSPVDVRTLSLSMMTRDGRGELFQFDRTKTGKSAIGTLTDETQALLRAYIKGLPFTLHPETPIFHTRGGQPGPKGGRPRPPVPYSKDMLGRDFREVRAAVFPDEEKLPEIKRRKVMDFRRSGSTEAIAGQVSPSALAGKMGNSIDTNKNLQDTYLPNQAAVVRIVDEARERGRDIMRANANAKGPKA